MVNWRITAKTIYCEAVDDEVTLLVYKDGSARCTGCKKYGEPGEEMVNLVKRKSKQLKRQPKCDGPDCYRIIEYRDKLFAEEAKGESSKQASRETVLPGE